MAIGSAGQPGSWAEVEQDARMGDGIIPPVPQRLKQAGRRQLPHQHRGARINGRVMGEEIELKGKPQLAIEVKGTAPLAELIIVRDGVTIHSVSPNKAKVRLKFVDRAFAGSSYYHVRVIQADTDPHGNPSYAWSSPIWVRRKPD